MTPTDDVPDACDHCGAVELPLLRYDEELICSPCLYIAEMEELQTFGPGGTQ